MEPKYLSYEPHRISDMYRNHRPDIKNSAMEKYLDFIEISEDGYTILSASDLTGRYWRGVVWYFRDPSVAPNRNEVLAGIGCYSSVCDGKFLGNGKTVVFGEDTGAVRLYQFSEHGDGPNIFIQKSEKLEHDSCILSVSVSSDKTGIVTAGMDMSIKVWGHGAELELRRSLPRAHSHSVMCVSHSPAAGAQLFASCGLDGAALLWDLRQPRPASVVVDNRLEGLTALTWMSSDENTLAVGSSFGAVSLVDIRTMASVKRASPHNRGVYKLLSINASSLASCADSHEVKIMDTSSENLTVSYIDERHTDFVRGLAFDKRTNVLYSCGWDQQVFSHPLSS